MLEEMRVRNYSPRTITTYISMVATMSKHFGKSPDLITSGELKDYLFQKVSRDQLSPSTINQIISAFKILQVDILGKEWDSLKIRRPKTPKTLPVVFSKEEVSIILGRLKKALYEKNWHVYIKKTFKGAGQVISYLGRYTHRVAISNSRISNMDGENVSFRWKDYRDSKQKIMTLQVHEFARRFLRHILPDSFYKIRYYGILASSSGNSKLRLCLELLGMPQIRSPLEGLTTYQILEKILGPKAFACPCCLVGKMIHNPNLKNESP